MNPYVLGGMGVIILILGWQLKSALKENGVLEANLAIANAATNTAADANETNMETIAELQTVNKKMVEARKLDAMRRETILDERDQELAAARAEAQALRENRDEAFNENPDCADLASLRVDFFCPTVASELRERATSQGSN